MAEVDAAMYERVGEKTIPINSAGREWAGLVGSTKSSGDIILEKGNQTRQEWGRKVM